MSFGAGAAGRAAEEAAAIANTTTGGKHRQMRLDMIDFIRLPTNSH
jgi:hypothetical protein